MFTGVYAISKILSNFALKMGVLLYQTIYGHPRGSDGKESACNVGDQALITGSGRSPGGVHDNPLQYSCLENPMDGVAWRGMVHGVTKESDKTE